MRKIAWLVVAAVLVLGATGFTMLHLVAGGQQAKASVRVPTSIKTYSMTVAGRKRSYDVIAPDRGLPSSAPVIVFLSGLGASVPEEVSRDDMAPYVTADEAELVYPVAVDESWNAIGCCGEANTHHVNDVAFLKALVAKVNPGNKRSSYVIGFSNGARLAYRIACTDPGLFDAYAMVKGVPMPGCVVRQPLTIIQIAATDDSEIPYKPGDHGLEPLPVTTEVSALRNSDQCAGSPAVTHSQDMTLSSWSGCAQGTRLALAVWPEGDHLYPRPPITKQSAAAVIWSFLTKTTLAPVP
jgi:polyhydroxybutyrate depolymerase